jgi:hypothetical protein
MKHRIQHAFALMLALALVTSAWAQWSSDPSKNLPLADTSGADQVQPKVKPLPNHGWYVSWFDSDPNSPPPVGYSVYLQRLSPGGVEQFRHGGVEVAHLGLSSTEDYGLDIDKKSNALLAFLDDRKDANNPQVTAVKMSPSGKPLWGKSGVALTADSHFHGSPKIAGASDGSVVVGWTSDSNVVLQKLDASGKPQWGKHGVVLSESGSNYGLADLHAAENGSVILSWVRDQGINSNHHLYANRVSTRGKLLWGKGHVKVFDGGSLQIGEFPGFITDGNGGAVFAWYGSCLPCQSFAQHILANGSEAFPHNGSVASTNTTNVRVDPAASYRKATDEVFLFWTEEDSQQSVFGIYAQKFDSKGRRRWGQTGLVIEPLGADQLDFSRTTQVGDGALAFWVDTQNFGSATIQATRLHDNAKVACAPFPVSTAHSNKGRPESGIVEFSGLSVLAFEDDRIGSNGIYIQNVNRDCSLGQK